MVPRSGFQEHSCERVCTSMCRGYEWAYVCVCGWVESLGLGQKKRPSILRPCSNHWMMLNRAPFWAGPDQMTGVSQTLTQEPQSERRQTSIGHAP